MKHRISSEYNSAGTAGAPEFLRHDRKMRSQRTATPVADSNDVA